MCKMIPITGTLYPFSETGTEGVVWSLTNIRLDGWDKLNCLVDGDYLTIFDLVNNTVVIWEGEIHYEYSRNLTSSPFNSNYKKQAIMNSWVNGIQHNVEPDTWMSWFINEHQAQLIKKEYMVKTTDPSLEPVKNTHLFPLGSRPE